MYFTVVLVVVRQQAASPKSIVADNSPPAGSIGVPRSIRIVEPASNEYSLEGSGESYGVEVTVLLVAVG